MVPRSAFRRRATVQARRGGADVERSPSSPDLRALFLRADEAAPPRTLMDVFRDTVDAHGDAAAIDDGHVTLSYRELGAQVVSRAAELRADGVRAGDRVGVRISSGTAELYVAILAVLEVGAAYVPVDVDDPDERARLVFTEADVAVVLGDGSEVVRRRRGGSGPRPAAADPPGRRVGHLHLGLHRHPQGRRGVRTGPRRRSSTPRPGCSCRTAPLGPGDRVLAGLSVAFDASCEEMWLAWAHGACLVPAPRALVRTGMDLGPWLVAQQISVDLHRADPRRRSGRPTSSAGGAAADLRRRGLSRPTSPRGSPSPGREVWNTYGPTEATVVACAARMTGEGPVRIGLPLAGWDLAVVDKHGQQVEEGDVGELVIGGVGLARYLDPARDAEKYAAAPDPRVGAAPTAAATSCASRPRGCSSSGAPTTRSSWAGGGSSWVRSTPRCRRCRGSPAPPPPCAPPPRGTRSWSATWCPPRAPSSTSPPAARRCAAGCPPRWCRRWPPWTPCRPEARARSTGTPCRGRWSGWPTRRAPCCRGRRGGWPSSGPAPSGSR